MSYLSIQNVKIVGLSACVPPDVEENISLPVFADVKEAERVITSTGIARKRIVRNGTTASDLSIPAIKRLLTSLDWSEESIDCLFFVSQTRDYIAPITSAILQGKLGFRNDCYCLDLPLGCAGWIYGMSNIASILSHGELKRGLLVCAETNSTNKFPKDRTVRPLFGDAATVVALEFCREAPPMQFEFGVDGAGYNVVCVEYGGSRNPVTMDSLKVREVEPGIWRRGIDMAINGMDLFSFAIKVPPKSLSNLISHYAIDVDTIDYLWLHQSNHYIDDRIRKKIKLPVEKVLYCLQDYGNTASASIPLTMVVCASKELKTGKKENLACSFGVGLAWASMHFITDHLQAIEYIEYEYEYE